jgi:hypothetical protein
MGVPDHSSRQAFGLREIVVLACLIVFFGLMAIFIGLSLVGGPHSRTSPDNACINNLRIIDAAKQQWTLEEKKTASDTPTWDDLKPYFGREYRPGQLKCPLGGVYTIGALSNVPTCSIGTNAMRPHILR